MNAPTPPPGRPARPAGSAATTPGTSPTAQAGPAAAGRGRAVPLAAVTADPTTVLPGLWREHGPLAPVELEPGVPAWLVMGYRELLTITKDEERFSRDARNWRAYQDGSVPADSPLGPMMFPRDNVIGFDGGEHRRLRRPLQDAIASIDHRRLRHTVERLCTDLIAGFAVQGHADLVADYAAAIPALSIGELIGLDPEQARELLAAMHLLFSSGPRAQEGNARFEAVLGALFGSRLTHRRDDLTSFLIDHPDLHTDSEVVQTIVVLVSAGKHTSISWISQTLRMLLSDPRFAGQVRGGQLPIDNALDEVLAVLPPMINMPARYALADTKLSGRVIARGDALILGLGGAARDPRVHDDLWWTNDNRANLAWSAGPHACPARDPARTIARTAIATAQHLLPDMELACPPGAITALPSPWTAIPTRLPVTFTAAPTPVAPAPPGRHARL
ncbi:MULTISPECIES: cytochrome P450 [Thermomonosporaceae]|uniref:cytochrome P450 n=1 Tax=Thermomonosporaceae TaxID=2012 RepID=UPI00255AD6AC|nr:MULTISPECIES: cytochrome P450 [Thermomonosporaceae]MDL4774196.1 cytochrome P450 [Actinomadura xylanilytica]